jgi:hypothetical protein
VDEVLYSLPCLGGGLEVEAGGDVHPIVGFIGGDHPWEVQLGAHEEDGQWVGITSKRISKRIKIL